MWRCCSQKNKFFNKTNNSFAVELTSSNNFITVGFLSL